MSPSKGLITIAVGKKYAREAKYLAYSCMLHAPNIIRAVITDVPDILKNYYDIIIPYNPEYGNPFTIKLKLHLYTPFEKTLFIDADSLVLHPLDMYWDLLIGRAFAYEGKAFSKGFWYFDIEKIIKQIDVPGIPKFNSGMFLFEKNEFSRRIFTAAYDYLENNGAFDISFFRGNMLPDEPFLAMALAKHSVEPVEEYGRFSRTLIGAEKIRINVMRGIGFFVKNNKPVFPLVVHFCGRLGKLFFLREKIRLCFYFNNSLISMLVSFLTCIRKKVKKDDTSKENPSSRQSPPPNDPAGIL
jgi:hypothetical protein